MSLNEKFVRQQDETLKQANEYQVCLLLEIHEFGRHNPPLLLFGKERCVTTKLRLPRGVNQTITVKQTNGTTTSFRASLNFLSSNVLYIVYNTSKRKQCFYPWSSWLCLLDKTFLPVFIIAPISIYYSWKVQAKDNLSRCSDFFRFNQIFRISTSEFQLK